jgi:hypothetical protein
MREPPEFCRFSFLLVKWRMSSMLVSGVGPT